MTSQPSGSTLVERMRRLSSAEEFFALLGVPYDPQVLHVARLHILRRMSRYLADTGLDSLTDDAAAEACRAALARAYTDYVNSTPLEQREFKVLKEAAKPTRVGFVPFSAIAVPSGES